MDDLVKAALKKWPNVPHAYGWLGLDTRGDWYLRDERVQAAGPFPQPRASFTVGGLSGVTLYAFGAADVSLAFATLPFMIWAGVAFGSRVVVIEQVLMACAVTWLWQKSVQRSGSSPTAKRIAARSSVRSCKSRGS